MASVPSFVIDSSTAEMFREYAAEEAVGTVAGRLSAPMMVTPAPVTTVSPGTDPATLPPSALEPMSTMTEPGFMAFSASSVTSSGGRRPGTCAVVMTTSWRAMWPASSACCAARSSSVRARA